jgi:tripartite-type tricarboxylate transporter receptor subunit TctC
MTERSPGKSDGMFSTRPALKFLGSGIVAGLIAVLPSGAMSQSVEQFYSNRNLTLIVPFGPGAYYDVGTRLVARHLGKHIPGHPNIVVQNQPSAGGIGLANRFATGADNDGALLGVLQRAVPQYAFVGYQSAKFDPLKLTWIGSVSSYQHDAYLMVLNASHPVRTIAELRTTTEKTRLGSGRSGSANLLYGLVAADVLKINIDMVRGYEGTAPIFLAQERGEVDGLFADLSTIQVAAAEQWRTKKIVPVVQFGRKTRFSEVSDVPTARELITDQNDLDFLDFSELPFFIALPLAGPVGMPADRVKALRDAFVALANDQAFLDEAKKMNYEVSPIGGDKVLDAIEQAAKASSDVKARFKALISQ